MNTKRCLSFLLVIQLLIGVGCDFEKSDWEAAKAENKISTFEKFITEYGESTKIDSAHYYIQKINLDSIIAVNTIEAYEGFLKQYPQGYFNSVTLDRINDLIPKEPQILNLNIHSTKKSYCQIVFDMDVLHKIGSISPEDKPGIFGRVQCGKKRWGYYSPRGFYNSASALPL